MDTGSYQKMIKELSKSYQKVIKKLSKSYQIVIKKLSKSYQWECQSWITNGFLKSMAKRVIFHKDCVKEKDPVKKERLGSIYRSYRNLIVRDSKKKYHSDYFEEHKQNMKKHGMAYAIS